MDVNSIQYKLNALPDEFKKEVSDFIDFLLSKKKESNIDARFDFSWEGGLSDMKGQYTSVDLQHRAADWR